MKPIDPTELLVPKPQSLRQLESAWRPQGTLRVAWRDEAGEPAWRRLKRSIQAVLGHRSRVERVGAASLAEVVFDVSDDGDGDGAGEAYRLRVDSDGVRISARAGAGLAHGASTLAQWLAACRAVVVEGRVDLEGAVLGVDLDDRPDVRHRGLMLDISRNRIPTMPELERLVEQMASFKFNQLQLYMEHTFAYEGHETVWRGYDPMTADEIRMLAAWCGERHIELVPNQNSFGHLHRWLVHEPYRRLAECPGGIAHPFSPDPEPFSLCPIDPGSLDLLRDLYAQLLPNFPPGAGDSFFHVGLDETLDLGLGRSREACERLGTQRVYLDFLRRVRDLAAEHGRRILFWGDIILDHPEALEDLPNDAVALAWGYEADHPFDEPCRKFASSGLDFWVCPGTSSWNSFSGRTRNLLANTARAAAAGREHGAGGYLLCDWGDHGHLQPQLVSLPGLVAGADCAWNSELPTQEGVVHHRRSQAELAALLDLHLLDRDHDSGSWGTTLVELGDVHRLTGASAINGSSLFFQLLFAAEPNHQRRAEGMTAEGLAASRRRLGELRPAASDLEPSLVTRELAWAADMLDLGADLAQVRLAAGPDVPLRDLPGAQRRRLLSRLAELLDELGPLWTSRSRPGGLEASRRLWRRALAGLGH